MTPIDMVRRAAAVQPDAVAVEAGMLRLTYAELIARAHGVAAALRQVAEEPGARVGICATNSLEHLIAFLATFAAGHVWVPLYPRLGAAELPRLAEFAEVSLVFAETEHRALFEGLGVPVVSLDGGEGAETLSAMEQAGTGKMPGGAIRLPDDTQAIKFTGGTTGLPKGVMQPIRAWNTNAATQIMEWDMRAGDRTLIASPMTHGGGTYLIPTLASGGTLVIVDRLKPEQLIGVLAEQAIATVFLPPTAIQMMAELPNAADLSFPKLRNLIYGGGPMRPESVTDAQRAFGPCVATTYGQTEAPQIATCLAAEDLLQDDLRASVGRETLLTRVAVMDDKGEVLPAGEIGEVVVRGDLVMTGYWRQGDKTAETLIDGWLHTGDLGLLDERGYLFLKGRSRDVIISGGFNVYPGDVEHVLGSHPAVRDCAVFGVPDTKWGEAVHAAVELAGETDSQALIDHVKAALGSVKAPKRIHICEALPRNAYGKLQRQALIETALANETQGDE